MDLAERQGVEEGNAAAELQALLAAAVDAIVTIDETGKITSFNAAAERMFGYAAAEMLGAPVSLLMGEPHRSAHQGYVERYLGTGEARIIGRGREVLAMTKSGEPFPISLAVGEAVTRSGRRFVGIIRDLTKERAAERERRSLEARLAHVGRFSLMGEMAAGIAHEINQPLGAITTYAQAARRLARAGAPDIEAIAEACDAVARQAQRASQVIENLRGFIRKEEAKRDVVDVNRAIDDVLPLVEADARASGVAVDTHFGSDLPMVRGDAVQLQQVVLNLTRNAVDAMRDAGSETRWIRIRTKRGAEGQVEASVTDSGPGVSQQLGDAIFHPFVTTKREGLGVGLAISRTIVQAHGGTLSYRPNPPGGSVFLMSLPVALAEDDAENDE